MTSTANHISVSSTPQAENSQKVPVNSGSVIKSSNHPPEPGYPPHSISAAAQPLFPTVDFLSVASTSRNLDSGPSLRPLDYLVPPLYYPPKEPSPTRQLSPFSLPGGLNPIEQSSTFLSPPSSLNFGHSWAQPGSFHQEGHQLPQVKSLVMPSAPLYYNRSSPILWQQNYPQSGGTLPSVIGLASPQQFAGQTWNPTGSPYRYDNSSLIPEGFESWAGLPYTSPSPGSPSSIHSNKDRSSSRSSQDLYRPFSDLLESTSGETSVIRTVQPKVETLTQPKLRESAPPTVQSPSSVIVTQKARKRNTNSTTSEMKKPESTSSDVSDGKSSTNTKKKNSSKPIDQSASTIYVPAYQYRPPVPEPKIAKKPKKKQEATEEDNSSSAESELKIERKKKRKKYVKPGSRTPPPAPVLSAAYGLRNKVIPGIVFAEGEKLEACDTTKTWYKARIVTVNKDVGQIYVHFEGWNSRYDEWLPMASRRIRPLTEEKFSEHQERYNIGDYLIARWSAASSKPGIVVEVQTDPEKYVILYHDGCKRLVTNKGLRRMSPVLRERFANELKQLVEVASTYPLLQDSPSDLEASPLYVHETAANSTDQSAVAGGSSDLTLQHNFDLSLSAVASTSRVHQQRGGPMVESQLLITSSSKPKRQPKKPWKLEDHVEIVRKKRKTKTDTAAADPVVDGGVNVEDIPTEKEPSPAVLRQNAIKSISPLSFVSHDAHHHAHDHRSTLESLLESPIFRMSPPDKPSESPERETGLENVGYEDTSTNSSSSLSNSILRPQRSTHISTSIPLAVVPHTMSAVSPVLKSMLKSPERPQNPSAEGQQPLFGDSGLPHSVPLTSDETAALAADKKDSKNGKRKRAPKPPAPKELIVCVDHNAFKCTVPECHKSFRKQKLLHDHLRHYHHMEHVEDEIEPTAKPVSHRKRKSTTTEEPVTPVVIKTEKTSVTTSPPSGVLEYFLPINDASLSSSSSAVFNEFSPENFPAALPETPSQHGFFGQSLAVHRVPPTTPSFPRNFGVETPSKVKKEKQPKRDSLTSPPEVIKISEKRKTTFKKKKETKEPAPEPVVVEDAPDIPEEPVVPKKRNHHKTRIRKAEIEPETDEEEIIQYIQNDHELVHCKCNYELENGFMVQCELCATWQHGSCYDMEEKKDVPIHYVCDFCRAPKSVRSSQRNICHDLPYIRSGRLSVFFPLEEDVEESTSSTIFPALPSPSGFYQNVNRPLYRDLAADTISCNDQLKALKRISRALVAAEECESKSSALLTGICRNQSERVKLSNLIQSLPEDVIKNLDLSEILGRLTLALSMTSEAERPSRIDEPQREGENAVPATEVSTEKVSLVNGFGYSNSVPSPEILAESVPSNDAPFVANGDIIISPASPLPDPRPTSPEPFEPFTPTDEEVAGGDVKGILDSAELSAGTDTAASLNYLADVLPCPSRSTLDPNIDRIDSPEIEVVRSASLSASSATGNLSDEGRRGNEPVEPADNDKPAASSSLPILHDLDPEIIAMCLQGDISSVLIAVNNRDDVLARYLEEIESRILEIEQQCDAKYGTKFATTPELAQQDWYELQEKLCRQQSDLRNLERLGHVVAVEPRSKTVRPMPGPLPIPSSVNFTSTVSPVSTEVEARKTLPAKIRLPNGKPPKKRPTKSSTKVDVKSSPAVVSIPGDHSPIVID